MIKMTIYDWMKATHITSLEFCGVDYSHIDESFKLPMNRKSIEWSIITRQRLYCNDGFSMSVQGGFHAYSEPRKPSDFYESMEVGFLSEKEILLHMSGDVSGYVDVELLQKIVDKHGGIDIQKSLKGLTNRNVRKYLRYIKLERILKE